MGNKTNDRPDPSIEVFTVFGMTLAAAQAMERELGLMMMSVFEPDFENITTEEFDALFEFNAKKTLGKLISELGRRIGVPTDLETRLEQALRKRNWLAHHYFAEMAKEKPSVEKLEEMLSELWEILDYFEQLHKDLTAITAQWIENQSKGQLAER